MREHHILNLGAGVLSYSTIHKYLDDNPTAIISNGVIQIFDQ